MCRHKGGAKRDPSQPGWHGARWFPAALLDSCVGLAILSTLEKGVGQTTLEFKISLVRGITTETAYRKRRCAEPGSPRGHPEARIKDSKGRLVAHGSTTCLIFER